MSKTVKINTRGCARALLCVVIMEILMLIIFFEYEHEVMDLLDELELEAANDQLSIAGIASEDYEEFLVGSGSKLGDLQGVRTDTDMERYLGNLLDYEYDDEWPSGLTVSYYKLRGEYMKLKDSRGHVRRVRGQLKGEVQVYKTLRRCRDRVLNHRKNVSGLVRVRH